MSVPASVANSVSVAIADPASLATPMSASIHADEVWQAMNAQARASMTNEPLLTDYIERSILGRRSLCDALGLVLATKLASADASLDRIREIADAAYVAEPILIHLAARDICAVKARDPATEQLFEPLLFSKGFQALQAFRIAHWLWQQGQRLTALYFQSRISHVFDVDIHPAATIGGGIMIDHATSVVIGETAVVGDNVSLLHEVTLGGTGKNAGDRHPKLGSGVLVGAGAKLLGNITIGDGAKIGAGSVVLIDVPAHCTAAGVPAIVVGCTDCEEPALAMDHSLPAC